MKRFNRFIFLSNFSRFLIEIFIPIILYKNNNSLNSIIIFLLVRSLFSLILLYPLYNFIVKVNIRVSLFLSIIPFILSYIFLYNYNLILLSLFCSISSHLYFISKNLLTYDNLGENKIGKFSCNIMINTTISSILGAFIGGYLLTCCKWNIVLSISVILFSISTFYSYNISIEKNKINYKEIFNKKNLNLKLFYAFEQFKFVTYSIFPLYIFIYVSNSFLNIGYFNLIVGIASLVCIKLFTNRLDKNNKDYLIGITLLFCGILIFKLEFLNLENFLIFALTEGIISKLYDTISISKTYILKNTPINILLFETYYSIGRVVILTISLFISDIKYLLYFLIIGIFLSSFLGTKKINLK